MSKLTKKEQKELVERYKQGVSAKTLARDYGIVPRSVYYYTKPAHKKAIKQAIWTVPVKTETVEVPKYNPVLDVARAILCADLSNEAKVAALRIVL